MPPNKTFSEGVLHIVRQIPYGKVTTYGAIAGYLGSRRSARMVGWVLNRQKGKVDIPAHRVVNRKGLLTGKIHFDGSNLMQELLESEGVQIANNRIVDLEKHFWEPEVDC